MNAYELADELNACFTKADWDYVDDCVSMLRQQADKIAELEQRPAINKQDGLVCAKCFERIGK